MWNHFVIQQVVFSRIKIIYYIASSVNNSDSSVNNAEKSRRIWFKQFLIFRKMQKLIGKLPKCFTNCKLEMANSNPGSSYVFLPVF